MVGGLDPADPPYTVTSLSTFEGFDGGKHFIVGPVLRLLFVSAFCFLFSY